MRNVLDNLKVKNLKQKERSEFALQVYLNKINESIGTAYAHLWWGGCTCAHRLNP